MEYSISVEKLIRKRKSWRTYVDEPIKQTDVDSLKKFIENVKLSPFDGDARFEVYRLEDASRINQIATYGFVKGAPMYILGAVKNSKWDLEHYAFQLERIILKATEMNLGTCWMGGTFDKGRVARDMGLKEDEKIPAVSPLGYVEKHGVIGRVVRWVVKAKKRKSWEEMFFRLEGESLVPLNKKDEEKKGNKYSKALEMVRLGPSAKNKQPWRIVHDKNEKKHHIYRADPHQYAREDAGIAVCHFHLSVKEDEIQGTWRFLPNSEQLTEIVPSDWHYTITWIED